MAKSLIYYYKENKTNMPILTGSSSNFECILYKEEINKITEMFPRAKNNLYVLIDGHEFKLD
ncbi:MULTISPECIES: hypothetical protein [Bacillus cereus group]|uniref:hypothetical protein n=1 Tax=Bacillus cereus group TaxID=86661 RepID=UPI00081984AD|nr:MULTISPECIES: hypothetical protein [Bacillus cereus group]ANY29968.1 hypothetical protein [Phage Wrath]MBG9840863.1 hypothetical protein [Bacillus tropicus]MBG9880020.1 hypothetical protein [Bacillus tropicus]MBG9923150.1 hypothetical protein [Bacillus tropicus]MBJ8356210.1 hypothetical protein [Bacillus mycoides]